MKREIITIGENGKVHIPTTPVWMSACEIADLFDVFSGKVNSHIKSVFQEGLLREDEVMQTLPLLTFTAFSTSERAVRWIYTTLK